VALVFGQVLGLGEWRVCGRFCFVFLYRTNGKKRTAKSPGTPRKPIKLGELGVLGG
jgi:hypothetical protein